MPLLTHVFNTDKQLTELRKQEEQMKLKNERIEQEKQRLEADIKRKVQMFLLGGAS